MLVSSLLMLMAVKKRKYTGEPYITHPIAVAKMVAEVTEDVNMICAALLHDVIEDTHVTYKDLINAGFGIFTAKIVLDLTNFSISSDGNRAARNELDRRYIERASSASKTIKLADLIHNSESIIIHAKQDFADTYIREKILLLKVLKEGDSGLYKRALEVTNNYKFTG